MKKNRMAGDDDAPIVIGSAAIVFLLMLLAMTF